MIFYHDEKLRTLKIEPWWYTENADLIFIIPSTLLTLMKNYDNTKYVTSLKLPNFNLGIFFNYRKTLLEWNKFIDKTKLFHPRSDHSFQYVHSIKKLMHTWVVWFFAVVMELPVKVVLLLFSLCFTTPHRLILSLFLHFKSWISLIPRFCINLRHKQGNKVFFQELYSINKGGKCNWQLLMSSVLCIWNTCLSSHGY